MCNKDLIFTVYTPEQLDVYALQIRINLPGNVSTDYTITSSKINNKAFDGGHVFVTLVNVNFLSGEIKTDSFGFYPAEKEGIIKGSNLKGEIKNDSESYYDTSYTFFISKRNYENALNYAEKAVENPPSYNLYKNNCVNFGINVAKSAGLNIPDYSIISNPSDLNKILKAYKELGVKIEEK